MNFYLKKVGIRYRYLAFNWATGLKKNKFSNLPSISIIYSVLGLYYRDLIISVTGKDINGKLIQALIAVYLGDDARTDAISARLREVSPGLYNQDDALSSKAQEILIKARNQTNPLEKEKMITEAINICKDVAAKLNLEVSRYL